MQHLLVVDYRAVSLFAVDQPLSVALDPYPSHQRSDATAKRQREKTLKFAGNIPVSV